MLQFQSNVITKKRVNVNNIRLIFSVYKFIVCYEIVSRLFFFVFSFVYVRRKMMNTQLRSIPTPRGMQQNKMGQLAYLDAEMYEKCKAIHFGNAMAGACRSLLLSNIFQIGLEFYWKDKRIKLKSGFKAMVDHYWTSFGKDVVDQICICGVVPVKLSRVRKGGDRVPVVMNGLLNVDYQIGILMNSRTGLKEFYYIRLRKNNQMITPYIDNKVSILHGFGYDPTPDGRLTSLVTSIVEIDDFIRSMMFYTIKAENNKSDPTIFTEVDASASPLKAQGNRYDYYVNRDREKSEAEGRYETNIEEQLSAIQNQQAMMEQINEAALNPVYKTQYTSPIRPLPFGHKMAKQNLPQSRSDLSELFTHMERLICGSYKVPRTFLIADTAMSENGVKMTKETMTSNINDWKRLLSRIFTDVYRSLYGKTDSITIMDVYTDNEIESMTEAEYEGAESDDTRVKVVLPVLPLDTHEEMLNKYLMGIIKWPIFSQMSKLSSGYPVDIDRNDKEDDEDPWNSLIKLSALRAGGKKINALGLITDIILGQKPVIPTSENKEKTKEKKDSEPSKKKKSDKSESDKEKEKKKKKRKREVSDSDSD